MSLESLIRAHPIVVSVQAAPDSPLAQPEHLLALARASLDNGAAVLRLQGVESIQRIKSATNAPVIGLIKRDYADSPIYITPTAREVDELIATGCEAVALDATTRPRPGGASFADLAKQIHAAGCLVFADCDNLEAVHQANACGADIISTTLAGYTDNSTKMSGPDLDFLRAAVRASKAPVVAEGRFVEKSQVQAAMRIGAIGIVMGGAVNDPVKQTRMYCQAVGGATGPVAAFDIGGTWLRYGRFSPKGVLQEKDRVALPAGRAERLRWMRERATGASKVGVSTGGTVHPRTGRVIESKPTIPENVGTVYDAETLGLPTIALNDGLASAWGHACHPDFAGKRVATLALGTGVGCGFVAEHRLHIGSDGGYPRLNDLPMPMGGTIEDALGGIHNPDPAAAQLAASIALQTVQALWMPDVVILCGGVGLALRHQDTFVPSPYGEDAGLYGAAALALWQPL